MKKLVLFLLLIPLIGGGISAQDSIQKVLANTNFTMAWTPGANCTSYEVERSVNNFPFEKIQEIAVTEVITRLADEDKAIFRVRGYQETVDGRVVGPYSNPSNTIHAVIPPAAPNLFIVFAAVKNWFKTI